MAVDRGEQHPQLGVHPPYRGEVRRGHEAVGMAGLVDAAEVQERERAMVQDQVAAHRLGQRPVLLVLDRHPVDPGPGAVEQRELLLGSEQRDVHPGLVQHREDRPDLVAGRLLHGGAATVGVPGDPVALCARSIRRPVTMLVWLGRVFVCSTWARALRVNAPSAISRWKAGVPRAPRLAQRGRVQARRPRSRAPGSPVPTAGCCDGRLRRRRDERHRRGRRRATPRRNRTGQRYRRNVTSVATSCVWRVASA